MEVFGLTPVFSFRGLGSSEDERRRVLYILPLIHDFGKFICIGRQLMFCHKTPGHELFYKQHSPCSLLLQFFLCFLTNYAESIVHNMFEAGVLAHPAFPYASRPHRRLKVTSSLIEGLLTCANVGTIVAFLLCPRGDCLTVISDLMVNSRMVVSLVDLGNVRSV